MPCQSRKNDAPRRVVGANAGSYSCTDILFALLFIANLVPLCHTACVERVVREMAPRLAPQATPPRLLLGASVGPAGLPTRLLLPSTRLSLQHAHHRHPRQGLRG